MMKGIILAGDPVNNRLGDITLGIPKQLLPLYDKPIIYYPIETLVQAGILDILIITTNHHLPAFNRTLGDGIKFGARFSYAIQESPKGVAQAITIGQTFLGKDSVCLITGDTVIIGESFPLQLRKAINAAEKSANATIFVARDSDEEQYGKAILNNRKNKADSVVGTTEQNNYFSITGVYVFPNKVIKDVKKLEPSERGIYEITSLNEIYHTINKLQTQVLAPDCKWLDVNTPPTLLNSTLYIANKLRQNK